jgi:hypothetical protein
VVGRTSGDAWLIDTEFYGGHLDGRRLAIYAWISVLRTPVPPTGTVYENVPRMTTPESFARLCPDTEIVVYRRTDSANPAGYRIFAADPVDNGPDPS